MDHLENNVSKERILKAAVRLFSEKGFDATRVNEIAEEAKVNKALIYYYFKSKEDILDYLVNSLFESVTSIAADFVHQNVVEMIEDGRLDIEPNRLRFIDEQALEFFLKNAEMYYEKILDYAIEQRHIIRILMLESLKNSKHRDDLFRFLDLTKKSENNPIYRAIWNADNDFNYSADMVLFKFFFSLMPIINFAVYYDDYKKRSSLSDQEMRSSFLNSLKRIICSSVSGRDIMMISGQNC